MNDTTPINTNQEKAVMFADVSGSTRLYEVLGDARAFAAIDACLDILRRLTEAHSGRVVKTIGDEIMAVFPDVMSAVQAACEMQLVMTARAPIDNTRVAIRVGLHFGPVLESTGDGDVFGDTVNVAARMAGIANAGQIITTSTTVALLPPILRASTRTLNALSIKGKADDIEVREVIWQESEEMTMMVGNTIPPPAAEPTLKLIHLGETFTVDAAHPAITIGRDEQADIVIEDRRASRMHAKIERRRDKFVFVDISSNGSFVIINGETEIQLRREELVLRESGSISLGHPYKKDPTEVIEFFCQG
ncbi:MAG TPA: adenylate/guanylate cyclase domain-containing protein [Gallionella sp.]|nr:adenylate/guanylate cyclase domain-containing protein [Gallionella sp.]